MLVADDLGEISPRWPEIAKCFQSKKAYETARGTLEKGDGIGQPDRPGGPGAPARQRSKAATVDPDASTGASPTEQKHEKKFSN
jgi:hypothetical protein